MVLLPGCKCCQVCGWPGGVEPDSIEVVLEDVAARTFELRGFWGDADVYVPSFNGTFSLSLFTPGDEDNIHGLYYIYKGTSNNTPFQVGISLLNNSTVFDTSLWVGASPLMWTNQYPPPANTFLAIIGGLTFGRRCTKATGETVNFKFADNYGVFPYDGGAPFFPPQFPSANRDVSYESGSGCYLPGKAEADILFRTFPGSTPFRNPTTNTFPISRTVTDPDTGLPITVLGFRLAIRVVSVSLIYGSTSVPWFDNLGQTTCPTY